MVTVDKMSKEEVDEALNATFPPDEEGWERVGGDTGDMWDFDENAVLQGVLVDVRRDVGPNNSNIYQIHQDYPEGEVVGMWGSTLLDGRFLADDGSLKIPLGNEVRVEYKGKEKSEKSGRSYKNFEVFHRPRPMEKAE